MSFRRRICQFEFEMQAGLLPAHARRLDRLSRHIEPAHCAAHAPNAFFTSEEMQQYDELGYVVVRGLLSDSEVQRFCARFKRWVREARSHLIARVSSSALY